MPPPKFASLPRATRHYAQEKIVMQRQNSVREIGQLSYQNDLKDPEFLAAAALEFPEHCPLVHVGRPVRVERADRAEALRHAISRFDVAQLFTIFAYDESTVEEEDVRLAFELAPTTRTQALLRRQIIHVLFAAGGSPKGALEAQSAPADDAMAFASYLAAAKKDSHTALQLAVRAPANLQTIYHLETQNYRLIEYHSLFRHLHNLFVAKLNAAAVFAEPLAGDTRAWRENTQYVGARLVCRFLVGKRRRAYVGRVVELLSALSDDGVPQARIAWETADAASVIELVPGDVESAGKRKTRK